MKKIITALIAAALLAGCGNTDDTTPADADITDDLLSDTVSATDSQSEKNAESPDPDGSSGYFGTYINNNNCIITTGIDDDEEEDVENYCKELIADKELLYYSAERVTDQYNFIADRDKQGFFDSIGYSDLYKSENAPIFWAEDFLGETDDTYFAESGMFLAALDYSYYLVGEKLCIANDKYPEDEKIYNTDHTRDEVLAEYREIMDEAAEKATFENSEEYIGKKSCFNRLRRKNGSITNEEYFASPEKFRLEPSDDTIYIIDMFNGDICHGSTGTDIYVRMNVTVLHGDYAYDFDECELWLTEKGDHVMPFPVSVYENPYKGKSMEEIEAERNEDLRSSYKNDDPPTPAEAANEGAWFHFCEGMYEGGDDDDRSVWEKMLSYGSYALSVSDEGLTITPTWDQDAISIGDDAILSSMNDYGYDSGTVWIRPEPDGSGDIYIIYESSDGQREEYHTDQSPWF